MRQFIAIGLALVAGLSMAGVSKTTATLVEEDNVPLFLNYQGYLTDTLGNPLNNNYIMVFAIFNAETGGISLYTHSAPVPVTKGVFNVKLPMASRDTAVFIGGERRWLELSVNGHILTPRTEITTMAYGFRALYTDNSDMLDRKHAIEFIWNQDAIQTSANWHIDGRGTAESQLVANGGGLSNSAAVWGQAAGNNIGVHGSAPTSGVYGSSETGTGTFGVSSAGDGFGLRGYNANAKGTGAIAAGTADTSFYLQGGSGGAFTARHIGLFAYAHDTTGTGIATMGNRISDTVYTLPEGSGGSFNGATIGVYGLARDSFAHEVAGGFFEAWPERDTTWAWVAARFGGTVYKIIGRGHVSTVMPTRTGNRVLFAPESPEPFFEDLGFGQLNDGHCRVDLDPIFFDCVQVDDENPLKVFITPNDDCNGVYVRTDAGGFDVYELAGGRSSARFTWRVVADRHGETDLRLPVAPTAPRAVGTAVNQTTAPAGPTR